MGKERIRKEKKIKIEWQRLIIEKETCPRCGSTEQELGKAIKALRKLGIEVELKKKEIGQAAFKRHPQESNKIMIAGKPMEYWLNAKTSKSPCCSVCGDNECRTIELKDKAYETIPADLIVKAALAALQKGTK